MMVAVSMTFPPLVVLPEGWEIPPRLMRRGENNIVPYFAGCDCVDRTTEIVILDGAAGSGLVVKVQPDKKQAETETSAESLHSHLSNCIKPVTGLTEQSSLAVNPA